LRTTHYHNTHNSVLFQEQQTLRASHRRALPCGI